MSLAAGVVLAAFVLETALWWRDADRLQPSDFTMAFLTVAAFSVTAVWQFRDLDVDAGASVSGRGSRPADE